LHFFGLCCTTHLKHVVCVNKAQTANPIVWINTCFCSEWQVTDLNERWDHNAENVKLKLRTHTCHSAVILIGLMSSYNRQRLRLYQVTVQIRSTCCFVLCWLPLLSYYLAAASKIIGYLDWGFFRAFSSVVTQIPGYNSQRRGTARTLHN
jgi:hypothetical protein